jgi:hypothetical protein
MVEAEFVDSGKVHKVFAGQAQYNVELSCNLLWNMGWKPGFYVSDETILN